MIIENLNLHLGLTAREIVKWIKESLVYHGEKGELSIIDLNLNPFDNKFNNNSISI